MNDEFKKLNDLVDVRLGDAVKYTHFTPNVGGGAGQAQIRPLIASPVVPSIESKVEEIVEFVKTYMPHEFTTKLDVLNSIVWICPCNKDIHPLSERFCQSCGGFPTANSTIRYVTRKSE